ncbi:MAG: hypothetical protein ACXVPU_19610, partial [Bacteroidia bacterium]
FTSDNQGNTYAVKGNELTKYDKTGKLLYKYSDKNFGNISFVDASNMLRILVFYKDFLQVVLLDNTLSITGDPINLETIGFQQTQLVSSSHNNGFWLYDQQNFELIRFDQNLTKTQQTGNLTAVLNIDLQPDFLLEYDNKVYLNNPSTGILIFDVYGTYYKTVPVKNAACIQPIGDWIYYMEKDKVKAYNIKTEEEKEFNMPATKFNNFRIELGILMLRTPASISLYTAE